MKQFSFFLPVFLFLFTPVQSETGFVFTDIKALVSPGSVRIKWDSNIPRSKEFLETVWFCVERSVNDRSYQAVYYKQLPDPSQWDFTHTGLWPGLSYYRVRMIIKSPEGIRVIISKRLGVMNEASGNQ